MSLRLSGGRRLQSPPGATARPTAARVRLAVMNLLASELPGCHWLDLCCGSGLMGCEALQRGAAAVLAVERDRRIAAVAAANLKAVAASQAGDGEPPRVQVVEQEVLRFLRSPAGKANDAPGGEPARRHDLIYVDPPYASGLHGPVAAAVAAGGWLAASGTLIWECASSAIPPVPQGWKLLDERRYGSTTVVLLGQDNDSLGR